MSVRLGLKSGKRSSVILPLELERAVDGAIKISTASGVSIDKSARYRSRY